MRTVENYKQSGYKFSILKKGEKSAIFIGQNIHGSTSYEVHKLRIEEAETYTLAGKEIHTPKRERIASSEEFGTYGFAYSTLNGAFDKFYQLENFC